eukprot:363424_1
MAYQNYQPIYKNNKTVNQHNHNPFQTTTRIEPNQHVQRRNQFELQPFHHQHQQTQSLLNQLYMQQQQMQHLIYPQVPQPNMNNHNQYYNNYYQMQQLPHVTVPMKTISTHKKNELSESKLLDEMDKLQKQLDSLRKGKNKNKRCSNCGEAHATAYCTKEGQ